MFAWVGAGRPVSGNFFATVAQVLPVLLLATLLDARRRVSLEDHQLALYVFVVAQRENSTNEEARR